jgi:hypothetical protein
MLKRCQLGRNSEGIFHQRTSADLRKLWRPFPAGEPRKPQRRGPGYGIAPLAFGEFLERFLEGADLVSDFLFGAPELFLQPAEEFVVFALGKGQVVVGEVGILLLELAFDFIPGAFDFEFSHSEKRIGAAKGAGCLKIPQSTRPARASVTNHRANPETPVSIL